MPGAQGFTHLVKKLWWAIRTDSFLLAQCSLPKMIHAKKKTPPASGC